MRLVLPIRYPYHLYIQRFDDGCVGFHQMIYYQVIQSYTGMTDDELVKRLNRIRKVIVQGLDTTFENPNFFEKYKCLMNQYHDLIILKDFDFDSKTEENMKYKIRYLNEGIAGKNIHFSYTDNYYEYKRNKKSE